MPIVDDIGGIATGVFRGTRYPFKQFPSQFAPQDFSVPFGISISDIKLYGSAVMSDDDVTTAIGGAIDTSKKIEFSDLGGPIQVVSDSGSDTTQTVTVSLRTDLVGVEGSRVLGTIIAEVQTLNGTTPVLFGNNPERLLKAVKSASTVGNVAVEAQTPTRTGSAQAGGVTTITLDTGASLVDGFYESFIIRITGGAGAGQIRQIIKYVGATRVATVDHSWANPDATSTFRIAPGFYFERSPNEVLQVRRPFYTAVADSPGGTNRKFYEKVFLKNTHSARSLTTGQVQLISDPSGLLAFAMASLKNDTATNGANNTRQVAPSGLIFDTTAKVLPGGLIPGDIMGVWLQLTLNAGQDFNNVTSVFSIAGSTNLA